MSKFEKYLDMLLEEKTVKCKDCGKTVKLGECPNCGGYNRPFDSKKQKGKVGKEGKTFSVK